MFKVNRNMFIDFEQEMFASSVLLMQLHLCQLLLDSGESADSDNVKMLITVKSLETYRKYKNKVR